MHILLCLHLVYLYHAFDRIMNFSLVSFKVEDCNKIIQKDPTLSNIMKEHVSNFKELLELCEDIRNKIRRLLNVDALTV